MNNFKLNTQLYISFGVILLLLLTISIVSYIGFNKTHDGFIEYRGLAKDTNLAGRVQANMLMMRLSVLNYINTQSDKSVQQYTERRDNMKVFLDEAKKEIQHSDRAVLVNNIISEIDDYENAFEEVTSLFTERNRIVDEKLVTSGLIMRQALSDIIISAYDDQDSEAAFFAAQLQEHLLLARLYVTKYLVSNIEADANRAKNELSNEMPVFISKLDKSLQSPERRTLLNKIKSNHTIYVKNFIKVETVIAKRNDYINNTLNIIGPIVAENIESVKLLLKNDQDILGPKVQNDTETGLTLIIIISLVAIGLGLAIAIVMPRIIKRPIGGEPREIEALVNTIANGDLTNIPQLGDSSEGIYRSTLLMANNLKGIIYDINQSAKQLLDLSNQLGNSSSKVDSSSKYQMIQLELVAAAMNEMTATVSEVAQNAVEASDSSDGASKKSELGLQVVSQVNQDITKLVSDISRVHSAIANVQNETENVGGILDVIRGIADQTNLLALNAAIEAARAGEHGRGFAVVADEVRTLATKTQESTNEIQSMIETLQVQASQSVDLMSENSKSAEQTLSKSNDASDALVLIEREIRTIQDMNNQIATAAEEQSSVAAEINENVVTVNDLVSSNAEEIKKNVQIAESLNVVATSLSGAISMFKV